MIQKQTGESDIKLAYEKYLQYLAEDNYENMITKVIFPYDSIIQEITKNSTYQNIWRIVTLDNGQQFIRLNCWNGKFMDLLSNLSQVNKQYSGAIENIEIAGDFPSSFSIPNLVNFPEKYNLASEAEKLYVAITLITVSKPAGKSVKISTENQSVLRNKAFELIRLKKYEEALEQYKLLQKINSNVAEDWKISGMIYEHLGNTNEAANCYKKCIELYNSQLNSTDKQKILIASINKAALLILNNQKDEGQLLFEQLKKEYPNNINVNQLSKRSKQDYFDDLFDNQNYNSQILITSSVDTSLLRNAFIKYKENPTEINALAVYNVLPEKGHVKLGNKGSNIVDEIMADFPILENQVNQEKRNSVKLAFRLFTISDGFFTESLQILLGNLIQKNPEMFLQELKLHQHLCHELPILNFGPKFVDKFDEHSKEAERRIKALQTVNSPDLINLRDRCIGELQYKQERVKSILSLTIVDEWDYSPVFVNEMKDLLDLNTKMILDSNKITTNRDEIYYFPDYITLNYPTDLRGKNDKMEVQLFINRINQSTIGYRFQYKKDNVVSEWISGEAHLLAAFFFGDEMDKDERTGEIYSSQQFIDRNTHTNIRIGKGENNGLRAKIDDRNIPLQSCPVLTSEKKEWTQTNTNLLRNEIIKIGNINAINIRQLFDLLKLSDNSNEATFITFNPVLSNSTNWFEIRKWLKVDDVEFLISKLKSKEDCKCLVSEFSSYLPFNEKATIGGFAGFFLDLYRKNDLFRASLVLKPKNNPEREKELVEWWDFEKNTTTRTYNMGFVDVVVSQLKNNESEYQEDFLCRGTIKTFKNNIPVDSLKFKDMDAVGDSYGLNFSSQPIPDLIIGLKFGDYNGRLIIISESGKIENYPGGPFFIPKNKNLIVSPWHSDLSGITIYDIEKKKVVMQKEVPVYLSYWYNFQNEYYSAIWDNNKEINEIYKLDLEKFELVKSEKTLAEIKTGEKVEYYDSDCACN